MTILNSSFRVGVHVMVQDVNEFSPEWTTTRDDSDGDDSDDDNDDNDDDDDDDNPAPASLSVTVDEGQILEQVERQGFPTFGSFLCSFLVAFRIHND